MDVSLLHAKFPPCIRKNVKWLVLDVICKSLTVVTLQVVKTQTTSLTEGYYPVTGLRSSGRQSRIEIDWKKSPPEKDRQMMMMISKMMLP